MLSSGPLSHRLPKMENIMGGLWSQMTEVCMSVLSTFPSRLTLDKSLSHSEPQLLCPQNGVRITPSSLPSHLRFHCAWEWAPAIRAGESKVTRLFHTELRPIPKNPLLEMWGTLSQHPHTIKCFCRVPQPPRRTLPSCLSTFDPQAMCPPLER